MGPSSYKTHLAEYYIKINQKTGFNKIYLHKNTTIEDLLGGPYFLSQTLSKSYYFDLLSKIINYNTTNKDFKNNYEKEINNLENIINKKTNKDTLYTIYNNILANLKNILKNESKKPQIVFKEGEILLSILKEQSIIFKDIHKVPTEIFERFNELFSSERILSLNEDIYGTFFSENTINKVIDLNQLKDVLIIATCPENSYLSLSESILSRFSILCVGEHEKEKKKKIIENYLKKYNNIDGKKYLDEIIDFFEKELTDVKKIKNFIDIFHEMNKNNNQFENENNNFNYIKSIILLDKKDKDKLVNNNPFDLVNNSLISKLSKLRKDTDLEKIINKNIIVFSPVFNEMIDLIHFGICTGTSLIFEGYPGQGKQKAVNYVCGLLNYEIENIVITSNFSAKDLFKKSIVQTNSDGNVEIVDIETKLYEKIYIQNDSKNILFVFHNIHLAESDVLVKICEFFNKKPNDNSYSFIGFVDIKESLIERNSYYYNYFYNSIYYIVKETNNNEISSYLDNIPINSNCKSLILKYYQNKNNKNELNNNIFTLSDISKYIKLKEISKLDDSFLEEIIFKNRLNLNKTIINQEKNNVFDLDLYYINNSNKNELRMEVNEKSFSIKSNDILNNIEEKFNTLSFEQKKCLIFLGLSVKSNIPCIIKGETGVGKTHLIKLFSKIIGKKLHIFELNKDNDISLLTKHCIFEPYNEDEIKDINEKLNNIKKENILRKEANTQIY